MNAETAFVYVFYGIIELLMVSIIAFIWSWLVETWLEHRA